MKPWRTSDYYVSHYNYESDVELNPFRKKVAFHDVTLRDGEQQAGIVFRREDKVEIARLLDEAGVDRIEAGMPAVSYEDFEAVKAISREGLSSKIFAFARCAKSDVDLALKCDVDGVVMEIPSSDHILKNAYEWPERKAIDLSVEATGYAHEHGLHVAFFTVDATRATFESFWRLVGSVVKHGHMDSLVLADTFGVASPEGISHFVKRVRTKVKKPIEIHCHNDFGLGVANSIAGVRAGAEVVHATVNGIGERMGNASLEQVAMTLKMLYGSRIGIKPQLLKKLSRRVEELSGVKLPSNAPVVGDNIFTIESGIIVSWWNKLKAKNMPLEMFPYHPDYVASAGVNVLMGKKSGMDSVTYMARELNIRVPDTSVESILRAVKEKALREKRALTREEFLEIASPYIIG